MSSYTALRKNNIKQSIDPLSKEAQYHLSQFEKNRKDKDRIEYNEIIDREYEEIAALDKLGGGRNIMKLLITVLLILSLLGCSGEGRKYMYFDDYEIIETTSGDIVVTPH